jgi:hypothetical protein
MSQNKLISLKDASKISGYSPDYIGQLIRAGKIKGEKVYCQITWMTTSEDVMAYKGNNPSKEIQDDSSYRNLFSYLNAYKNRIESEFRFFAIFLKNIKTILPVMVIFLSCFIVLCFFILDNIFNSDYLHSAPARADNNSGQSLTY